MLDCQASQTKPVGVLQRKKPAAGAMRLLESLQLRGGQLDTPVARLSGGTQQKVLLEGQSVMMRRAWSLGREWQI